MTEDLRYIPSYLFNPEGACYCNSSKPFGECCGSKAEDAPVPWGINIIPDYLSKPERNRWMRYLQKQPAKWLTAIDEGKTVRDKRRVCQQVDISKKRFEIQLMICKAYAGQISNYFGKHFDVVEQPQILRYSPGGRYVEHSDSEQIDGATGQRYRALDRDVSMLIYLNDNYSGGGS